MAFFLWLVFAIVGILLANLWSMKWYAGALWGFFLGPIGLGIMLITHLSSQQAKRQPCPFCGESMFRTASVCPHCQREVAPAVPS